MVIFFAMRRTVNHDINKVRSSYNPQTGQRTRDLELTRSVDDREKLDEALHGLHFYNTENIDLDSETKDAQELENLARNRLMEGDIVAVLPAYIEPDTAPDVARYHQKLLPDGMVIAVSKHNLTRELTAPYASVVIDEDEVMQHVNFKALEEMAQLLYTEWFVKFKFPGYGKAKFVDER